MTSSIEVCRGEPTEDELAALIRALRTVTAQRGNEQTGERIGQRIVQRIGWTRFRAPQSWAPVAGPRRIR